ncbi:MAG: hypothetical protein L0271_24310 [Gemmatimonadetes bacterium]|nr:hypothetical protein [Gemmatimonadota bacterium]
MKRVVLAALVAVAALPLVAHSQTVSSTLDRPVWGPRIRFTPFVGVAPAVTRTERWTVVLNGQAAVSDYDVELASGWGAGASLEVLAVERFAFIASGAYVSRGRTTEFSSELEDYLKHEGSNFILAKAGVAVRLREEVSELQLRSLTATVFAGPAWVREMPKDDPFAPPALQDALSYWGFNFGADAEIPLGWRSLSIQGGVEDFYVFWDDDEFAARNDAALGSGAQSVVDTDPSHMWVFRIGLTFKAR